jgi:hypothetical protein
MSTIDTDIDHYSIYELTILLGLENKDEISESDVTAAADQLYEKYKRTDPLISSFFIDVKRRLIDEIDRQYSERSRDNGTARKQREIPGANEIVASDAVIQSSSGPVKMNDTNFLEYAEQREDEDAENVDGFNYTNANDPLQLTNDANAGLASYDQQLAWQRNQYLDDPTASGMYTSRQNKVQVSRDENGHYQMKQNRLGVINSYNLPVGQGTTNPTLRNTMSRIVNIDSQFRQTLFPYDNDPTSPSSSTSFTLVLSEPLVNVLSLKLYSISIPYSWYTIDEEVGNNVMYVDLGTGVDGVQTITVESGNYTPASLITTIKSKITTNIYLNTKVDISYSVATGKTTIYNYTLSKISVVFFDSTAAYGNAPAGGCKKSIKINNNLGWVLGFRSNNVTSITGEDTFTQYGMVYEISGLLLSTNSANKTGVDMPGTVISEAIVDTYGPKYFLLVIDDFTHNRVNSGLINIGSINTRLDVPSYYNEDIPFVCQPNERGTLSVPTYVPSIPRRLTRAQLYSINEIMNNRKNTNKDREVGPSTSDVFAVLPLRVQTLSMGQPIIEYGANLIQNERSYFGPVIINKLRITLKDDKGYPVNLHGNDWSFTLVTQELYEY